jgi:uncharacterized membrane protein
MNKLLWALQYVFGIYWVTLGVLHFVVPPGLPAQMSWMYELGSTLHAISGTLEILGGLGLILPAVFRMYQFLIPLAAAGLSLVMVGAMIWHIDHGSFATTGPLNIVLALVMLLVAWGRGVRYPLGTWKGSSRKRSAN